MLKKILLLSAMSVTSFDNSNASEMVEYNNDKERRAVIQFRSDYDNAIELFKQSSLAAQINDNPHNKELNIKAARISFERANRFMDQNMNDPDAPKVFNNEDMRNMYRHCMTLYYLYKGYVVPDDASLYLRMAISRAEILKPITYEMSEELYTACDYFSKVYFKLTNPTDQRISNNYNVTKQEMKDFRENKEKYDRWVNDAEKFRYKGYFESFTNAVTPVALKFWENRDKIGTLGAMIWNVIPTRNNSNNSNNQAQPNSDIPTNLRSLNTIIDNYNADTQLSLGNHNNRIDNMLKLQNDFNKKY